MSSLILRILGAAPSAPRDPWDDRWWGVGPVATAAGMKVDSETALKLSTVWRCRQLLSETVGNLPLITFENLPDDTRRRATNHPLYDVLHTQPNQWQSPIEFWSLMVNNALMRGNGIAYKQPGQRGPVDQLIPFHPDRVRIEKLPNGNLRYQVRQPDGTDKPYNQEDIFHLRGPSNDGVTGLSIIEYARESLGLGLASERYGARFFRNDTKPGGVLHTDKKLSPGAKDRLKLDWQAMHGSSNQHQVAVLEEGLTWQAVGITPEEAQFLGTREFQAEDVCRWFGIPPHMVGLTSKATSWGSGIEQMSIGFVTYTLMPWLVRIQQAISRDLMIAPQRYFAEFIVAGLLRGDTLARYQAYQTGINTGFMTRNEARRLENMNPLPGLDEPLQPLNMAPAGEQAAASGHYRLLAEESAARLVRKEIAAIKKIGERYPEAGDGWNDAVLSFYGDHTGLVSQTMRIDLDTARKYCAAAIVELAQDTTMSDWETRRVNELANLAMAHGMTTERALETVKQVAAASPFNR